MIKDFTQQLQFWYLQNSRDLPWRQTRDPYKIWISEVVLQQTRVDQGLAYYHRLIDHFPDVVSLANAPLDKVLRLWQGLGYYSRARNLHATACQVRDEYQGLFPNSHEKLLKLKGIGPYTAAAIASFAFDLPHAVVDGNVYRFLSRLYAIDLPIDRPEAKKTFAELAQSLLDKKNPAIHNQAMMEMGALICKASGPACESCPFVLSCEARQLNRVNDFPVKQGKTRQRDRHLQYLIIHDGRKLLLRQRGPKDIWQGLYEFPLVETQADELLDIDSIRHAFENLELQFEYRSRSLIHLLSHQKLHVHFWWFCTPDTSRVSGYLNPGFRELDAYAMPQLLVKYLNSHEAEWLTERL